MRAVVTGAAGFIGSHLCTYLLECGDVVVGVDSFTDYYDPALKERNLGGPKRYPAFSFRRADLLTAELAPLLDGTDVVFHLASRSRCTATASRPATSPMSGTSSPPCAPPPARASRA
ncbi:NAD-dependent epimerase/dehydratase family protein [Saccharothrix sp. ST-888]|uniref:NAD-dependent epimerase/dehydratase family protein n=1 Tax=Saccharothrix sp. ST-888 TaxID=1427391 RepID=UPI0006961129|nr:NAD-dependent epimerase/dehydratase family protein [Saccharothrix sp. ST-888]